MLYTLNCLALWIGLHQKLITALTSWWLWKYVRLDLWHCESPFTLPCKQAFGVYKVVRVACQSHSWFFHTWPNANSHVSQKSLLAGRLRVVPHFSSGIVERAKRERAWKSPDARKGDTPTCRLFSCEVIKFSTIPEEKWGTTRSLSRRVHLLLTFRANCSMTFWLSRKLIAMPIAIRLKF